MKKIEIIVRPEKVGDVTSAIEKIGYSGIMITEIEGHGKQKGVVQQWRGEKYKVSFLPKIKIEIVAKDGDVESIVKTVIAAARTGEIGDGKIFVSPVENTIRIRTGEDGEKAL